MPTKTFSNLREAKRTQVFEALLNEYSNHRLSDAKVSRIVQDCGIPRGSFYTYFTDLNDSYQYALKRVLDEVHLDVLAELKLEKQNTLTAFYRATKKFSEQILKSRYVDFYRLYLQFNKYSLTQNQVDVKITQSLFVNGHSINNSQIINVAVQDVTSACHRTIKAILLGRDVQLALQDLHTLLSLLNGGLLNWEEK